MAARPASERGAALLSVLVSVAVLTAMAANLAYDSRVALRLAANARDELRAGYQARSGVTLSRLVLSFQQQLDDSVPATGATGAMSVPRVQLWRLVPVESTLVAGLFGGGGLFASPETRAAPGAAPPASAPAGGAPQPAAERPAPLEGGPRGGGGAAFDARIEDEATKVNAQLEGLLRTSDDAALVAQVLALYQLTCDPQWDPIFDREDATGFRSTREDLLVRLRDWVDEDNQSSALKAGFGSTSCSMELARTPLETAFGDENAPYDRGPSEDRYQAKNARMDSLGELHLVAGVSDTFMAAFGDALTIYLPRNAKWNVNDFDRTALRLKVGTLADPSVPRALLADPAFLDRLQEILMVQSAGGYLSITGQQFGQAVELAGVKVNQAKLSGASSMFTDRSTTFRIRSAGTAGDVKTTVEAVVRLDKPVQGEAVGAPGRVIHWREE